MKIQNKTYSKVIKSYLKELKIELVCSNSMKQALISTIKQRILDLFPDSATLSVEDLYREIGTPEEISRSMECRSDMELLKRKAKRYAVAKTLCAIFFFILLLSIAFLVVVIISDQDYNVTTVIR